mmetsp:Transcript_1681/g.4411  ORF Transcript_1681/g.4411 Transcript_1681/m.4411 type:complete len:626 (-) Transcript_1681:1186-3063(-)|eukprot:CAMPEP_0172359514 /NCGR_PEP_ID=MMETSP1060-20121228/3698_1 /TAXON_ID=37318 /ORGANISM="Pseudo-nitzschia pungens, Strain cf. cingulata" /LENGTH=625 /DNA_ID=CAMNT_0013081189 /DNA_START=4320 /DNA_END=6197 /DNA_ORIENTATION=+
MNLELLDPFRKQIPDRIDSTLDLPTTFHFRKQIDPKGKGSKKVAIDEDWKSANHIAFNRRGSYIAVGYASGTVGVFDVLSRTVSSLYRQETTNGSSSSSSSSSQSGANNNKGRKTIKDSALSLDDQGVTSLSWSRRSRTLLVGSLGNPEVRLIDTTHPFGPEECCTGVQISENKDTDDDNPRSQSPAPLDSKDIGTRSGSQTPFREKLGKDHFKKPARLQTRMIKTHEGISFPPPSSISDDDREEIKSFSPASKSTKRRYPWVEFSFPRGIGNSLQIHPRNPCAGQTVLKDGSLVAFCVPKAGFEEVGSSSKARATKKKGEKNLTEPGDEKRKRKIPKVSIATLFKGDEYEVFCSAFDPHGNKIYAATKDGKLLGFEVKVIFDLIARGCDKIPPLEPRFVIQIPGNAWAWYIVVSRNGRHLVVNSSDGALRLYDTKTCWERPSEGDKPLFVFQNVVTKVKFASCDLSGDGEYLVGGAQGSDAKYELYIWNTSTGAMMDKLTGSNAELYSVAWHPTRSFLAVAADDGLVDIWGPRINWTAFAPDFQALPRNVEYMECEDEFDIVEDAKEGSASKDEDSEEDKFVDILTVEPVPVFQSDSEDEEDVFTFEPAVGKPSSGKGGGDNTN